jgi:hypothetical protein
MRLKKILRPKRSEDEEFPSCMPFIIAGIVLLAMFIVSYMILFGNEK